jgi:hypothetical protein
MLDLAFPKFRAQVQQESGAAAEPQFVGDEGEAQIAASHFSIK